MADVSLRIGAFIEGLKKGLNQAKGHLARFSNFVKTHEQKIRKARLGSAAALTGGILIMRDLTKAYGEQEQSEVSLLQAMKNSGTYTEERYQAALKYASAQQKMSNFGDEEIIQAQALLVAIGKLKDEGLEKATQATLDLAAAKKMDLRSAADLISKSIGSSTNALSRYGIEIDNTLKGTERAAAITEQIAIMFGGQAKAASETMTGQLRQLNMQWGDLKEDLGEAILPMLVDLAKYLSEVMPKIKAFVQENKTLVQVLAGGGMGGAGLVLLLSQFALLFANPATGWIAGIAIVAGAIAVLVAHMKDLKDVTMAIPSSVEEIDKAIADYQTQLDALMEKEEYLRSLPADQWDLTTAQDIEQLAGRRKRIWEFVNTLIEARGKMQEAAGGEGKSIIPIPDIDDIDAINAAFEAYEEKFKELDELHDEHVKKWIEVEAAKQKAVEDFANQAGWGLYNIWANSYAQLDQLTKTHNAAFLIAMIEGLIGTLEMAIEMYAQRIVAKKIAAMAEAGLEGLFNPLAWGKIALAGTIAGGAIASLNALAGSARSSMMKSVPAYEYGGVVPETGLAMVHKGERFFNPAHPLESAANMGAVIQYNHYGNTNSKRDIILALMNFEDRVSGRRLAGRLAR